MLGGAAALFVAQTNADAQTLINGAGATFPYPIYSKWISEYKQVDASVRINYQSIGSGGGQKQITAQTVDFGASSSLSSFRSRNRFIGIFRREFVNVTNREFCHRIVTIP